MKITIEDNKPVSGFIDVNNQFTLKIGGKDVLFEVSDYYFNDIIYGDCMGQVAYYPHTMSHKMVAYSVGLAKKKTKEQIAVEDSVAKAKDALQAAENALKAIKGGNNGTRSISRQ